MKVKNTCTVWTVWMDSLLITDAESPLTPLTLGSRNRLLATLQICSAKMTHMATLTACTIGVYSNSRQASLLLSDTHNQTWSSVPCFDAYAGSKDVRGHLRLPVSTPTSCTHAGGRLARRPSSDEVCQSRLVLLLLLKCLLLLDQSCHCLL